MHALMDTVIDAIDRYLNALARTSGGDCASGLDVYRLIEHRRERRAPAPADRSEHDEHLARAS